MEHSYFGKIDLEEGIAELDPISSADNEIAVEIDVEEDEPTTEDLDGLAEACKNHADWTSKVIAIVIADYDDLLKDALETWAEDDKSFPSNFNPGATSIQEVTPQQAAAKLQLAEIRMEVSEPTMIAFDFRFTLAEEMNYLVCGRFNCDGTLEEVNLES